MRPVSNGLVELIDDKPDKNSGFFCMNLVVLMWNDEHVNGWDEWHGRFEQARAGQCPYRDRCQRYEKTIRGLNNSTVQLNLF